MSDEEGTETREGADKPAGAHGWRLVKFDALKNPPVAVAATVYVLATLFALAVLVLVGFGLFASFHIAYETAMMAEFAHRVEAAKVFFPILLALVGGPLLIWRVITAHIQAQAARHQADTGREAHYTSLFTRAVEQLGATREVKEIVEVDDGGGGKKREMITKTEPNLEVRLGAIYALDRVARDSERDHWPIMEVLCAYIRNPQNSGIPKPRPRYAPPKSKEMEGWLASIQSVRVDVQAALTVMGQRPEDRRTWEANQGLQLDLRNANLQRGNLDGGDFERAIFDGAALDFASCHATNFMRASFYEAHLTNAWFVMAKLDGVRFFGAQLDGAQFAKARLTGARFDMSHAAQVNFDMASLARAQFRGARLRGTSFAETDLEGASFVEADLRGASFASARLAGAQFAGAKLNTEIVIGEYFEGASFLNAHLAGALFFGADISAARELDPVALADALGDASSKLPGRFERPAAWPDRVLSDDERQAVLEKFEPAQSRKA